MTSVKSEIKEYQQFIGGQWTAAEGGTFEDRDPFTGDVVALAPRGTRADAKRAIEAAAGGVPGLVADRAGRAPADLPESGRRAREPAARGGRPARDRDRRELRLRHVPDGLRARALPAGGGACLLADRADHPVGPSRHARDGRQAAGRRRRGNRTVERGADPVGTLDRGPARAREHRRAQAVRAVAGRRRAHLGRDLRRGRPARRRPEHRHARPRRSGSGRRRADREPGRAPHQLHRLDRSRSSHRRGRRTAAEARRARARWLQPDDRARRRRPRLRGQRLCVRRVPAPGPDLHVDAADLSSRRASPTSSRRGSPRRRRR